MAKNKLYTDFPPVSTEQWEEKIKADLKGADFEKKLVWRTLEGINVRPYYRSEDLDSLTFVNSKPADFPYLRGTKTNNEWHIRQDIEVTDALAANKKALDILMKGVTSLGFRFKKGLTEAEMEQLLNGIELSCVEINISGCGIVRVLPAFIAAIKKNSSYSDKVTGSINIDPFVGYLLRGEFRENSIENLADTVKLVQKELPSFKVISVHARLFHNAGSSIIEELGFGLAQGAEYLNILTDNGLTIDDAARAIKFNYAVGGNYFFEIAKFRAARLLWAKIVEAYNPASLEACKATIHAETSTWNKTIFDAHTNMLRTTTEAMSSAIAGVDSLTVCPFDNTFKNADEFSERIARNQQILLKEESYLNKTVDPSAGSYYIETLTQSIADEAWKIFLDIEEQGGFKKATEAGYVQDKIKATAQKRDANIAIKKEVLLGTNQFPNFNETASKQIDDQVMQKGLRKETKKTTLSTYRGAQAFEELRLLTEKSGKRPKAFMLTYGNITMRKARATFACNFFACAGFEVVDTNGFGTIEEGTAAAIDAKANIVVLCSSDDEYADIAIPALEQLKGKATVVVAGYPKAIMEKLQQSGIEHFIHVRTNLLESLQNFQKLVGIV